jgi:hypothetical protein
MMPGRTSKRIGSEESFRIATRSLLRVIEQLSADLECTYLHEDRSAATLESRSPRRPYLCLVRRRRRIIPEQHPGALAGESESLAQGRRRHASAVRRQAQEYVRSGGPLQLQHSAGCGRLDQASRCPWSSCIGPPKPPVSSAVMRCLSPGRRLRPTSRPGPPWSALIGNRFRRLGQRPGQRGRGRGRCATYDLHLVGPAEVPGYHP